MLVKLILGTYPLMLALGVIIFIFTPSTANAQTETVQYVQKCLRLM